MTVRVTWSLRRSDDEGWLGPIVHHRNLVLAGLIGETDLDRGYNAAIEIAEHFFDHNRWGITFGHAEQAGNAVLRIESPAEIAGEYAIQVTRAPKVSAEKINARAQG